MEFFDTHTHLQDKAFTQDRIQVINRISNAGIKYIINVGEDITSSRYAIDLAREHKNFYAAVGMHPHNAKDFYTNTEKEIMNLAKEKKVVAIGEIGLDFYKNFSPKERQIDVFNRQLIIAQELGLPIIIHTRDAYSETFNILKKYSVSGVFHAFSSTREDAEKIIDMGFYIGIGGILTFKNSSLKDVIKFIPMERIVLETDAPYLAPTPMRGRRNEPAFLIYTARYLSEIKNIPVEEIAHITTNNAIALFLKNENL